MQPECISISRPGARGRAQHGHIGGAVLSERWSLMVVKRLVVDDLEETFSIWEASPHWSCCICSEKGEAVGRIDLAAFWRCNFLHVDEEGKDLWLLELAVFPQISFVHPEAMARALEASGCNEDESEERKISALTSYYSGILIDPKSVREVSDKLPEPEKLQFKTLDEAKAYIARKTPALDALFESIGSYLAAPQDSSGATGWDVIAEMCFDEDCWETVTGRLKNEGALAGLGK